jgi:hypothetical protein
LTAAQRGLSELRGLIDECLPVPFHRQLDHRSQTSHLVSKCGQ